MGRFGPTVPNIERCNSVYIRYGLLGLNDPSERGSTWVFLVQIAVP